MVVQILKPNLVRVGGRFSFKYVEVDCVVVAKRDQHWLDSKVLQNDREDLVSFHKFLGETRPKLGAGDREELCNRDISDAFVHEDLPTGN
jgi:hypothetical protein